MNQDAPNKVTTSSGVGNPVIILALAFAFAIVGSVYADQHDVEREFSLKVLPLLKSKCFACHGDDPGKIKGDLSLLTRDEMLQGGEESDHVLVPGSAEESDLFIAVTWQNPDLEMPPKKNDRLTDEQIGWVRRWIDAGAPWPDEAKQEQYRLEERSEAVTADGVLMATSGGQGDDWTYRRYKPEDVWAFQPVVKPAAPMTGHPVDAFIDAKRSEAGFDPAPLADAPTLVRRIFYDVTGLPPTPEQMQEWVPKLNTNDDAAHQLAVGELVDALLDSPAYGERWAQHWLDIARYADTGGYSNDYERSNAWRYRDYVIRSLNADKPYDQFVIEQLAGDELADASVRERSGGDEKAVAAARKNGDYTQQESEWIVATGFLRMGAWDNAMVMAPEARQIYLDDVVNSVGQTFLATTMRCCKCHDHKFDPLPTRDYYRLYSAFAGTQMAERPAPILESENCDGFEEGREHVGRMLAFAIEEKNKIKAKQDAADRAWFAENNLEFVPEKDRADLPDEQKPPRYAGLDHIEQGQLKVREQDEWIWNRRLERYQPMAQSVYNGGDVNYQWNGARKLRIQDKGTPPKSAILVGGALEAPGDNVRPGVLSAIGLPVEGAPIDDPFVLPEELEGRRLALAKWVADPRNPLTTRSIMNRLWQYHFAKPLAGNPNNFGAKGKRPTHPQLLDWLAADFVEHGWSLKRMHRLLMTSRTYRQAGNHPLIGRLREKDPDNKLLAYFAPRRLTAEELRDSLLHVTDELVTSVGGLPIMPEINMEVALQPRMIQFSLAPAYQPSPLPELRNRRTIYSYRVRGMADPFLEIFNQPNPNDSCEARDTASVSPQVFTLLNSDVITDRSIAFARRLEKEYSDLAEQIRLGFQYGFGRQPDGVEAERMVAYVMSMREYHAGVTPAPVEYPSRITRSLVEEFSGEPFEYEEILPVFETYQPDTKPADVQAETRALADFCLLLFNSNEFMHIY